MKMLNVVRIAAFAVLTYIIVAKAQVPGDTVGFTQYDLQSICSSGNRIAADTLGGVHAVWIRGSDRNTTRYVNYSYCPPFGRWDGAVMMNAAGFPQLGLMPDGRAVVVFHSASAGSESLYCAIDTAPGHALFDIYRLPGSPFPMAFFWPYVTIGLGGNIHVLATTTGSLGEQMIIGYTRSTDGGPSWLSWFPVDTVETPSAIITASPVSEKVAIVYPHPYDTTNQWSNDVYYIQSLDGINWDWQGGKVSVTDYAHDDDSIAAYIDCDAVYDYNDNLHIVWHTAATRSSGMGNPISILHADQFSETIVEIVSSNEEWANCDVGAWNLPLAKMSLSVHPSNLLAVTYVRFTPADCSASGYANGDIYLQTSQNGIIWSNPVNLTDSPSPDCVAGNCESENWPSAAEHIDDYLHLFYVSDMDAGASPQTEGAITDNPLIYLGMPFEQLGADETMQTPRDFSLRQNYPNPFNAVTTISFELNQPGHVRLDIFDITGAKIATLLNKCNAAGHYNVIWNAGEMPTGVYYYRLTANGISQSKRMVLLK